MCSEAELGVGDRRPTGAEVVVKPAEMVFPVGTQEEGRLCRGEDT